METLLNSGVNIIAFQKNSQKFAMTAAWVMHLDYDKIIMLLGSSSNTGQNINVGDFVGISALSEHQIPVAMKLGKDHSLTKDKLEGLNYNVKKGAICINGSVNQIITQVEKITLYGEEKDFLIEVKVISNIHEEHKMLSFNEIN